MKKVFLGGTCNESKWREQLIRKLNIDYFNPVVEDWTEDCMKEEIRQREECDFCLYVVTPRMTGVYSIAEVVDDSNKRPTKTIFCVLREDLSDYRMKNNVRTYFQYFNEGQLKSLNQVGKMVEENGGVYFRNLDDVATFLNNH